MSRKTTKFTRQGIVIRKLLSERRRQDRQWGGDKHDDNHSARDFLSFIEKQVDRAKGICEICEDIDARLIKIGALAIAALEMLMREQGD